LREHGAVLTDCLQLSESCRATVQQAALIHALAAISLPLSYGFQRYSQIAETEEMPAFRRLLRSAATLPLFALFTFLGYATHVGALATGVVDLLLVLGTAFQLGLLEAAFASLSAVAFLAFFFMPPILSLYERDPRDWAATAAFTAIAVYLSLMTDRLHKQSIAMASERTRLKKLYQTSQEILMMSRREEVGSRLARLIADIFKADAVALWDGHLLRMDKAGSADIPEEAMRAALLQGIPQQELAPGSFTRVLRRGIQPAGVLYLAGAPGSNHLDARSADAIAALAAIALERSHSFLAESTAEAHKRSEQLRSTILDGLAHAFKTPLATIETSSSGLLASPRLGAREKELASLVLQEAGRLAGLTHKVLQTAELDAREIEVDREQIPLDEVLEQCQHGCAALLGNRPLRCARHGTVAHVWADMELLQMALEQVLDNAAKYAPPASPITLSIQAGVTETVFSVANEGSYIAPEERRRIFERYYRSPEMQYKASGTGIGLSVTQKILEAHGGRVWVESHPQFGTTFFLALPQAPAKEI
jgi:two-component system, OmpR family, sensor histidine kinase KdpD